MSAPHIRPFPSVLGKNPAAAFSNISQHRVHRPASVTYLIVVVRNCSYVTRTNLASDYNPTVMGESHATACLAVAVAPSNNFNSKPDISYNVLHVSHIGTDALLKIPLTQIIQAMLRNVVFPDHHIVMNLVWSQTRLKTRIVPRLRYSETKVDKSTEMDELLENVHARIIRHRVLLPLHSIISTYFTVS